MRSAKRDYIEKKYQDLSNEYDHLRMVAAVYNEFRKSQKLGYSFGGVDFFTNQVDKDGSWDVFLFSQTEYKKGRLLPIFIEVKGKEETAKDFKEDLAQKVGLTEKILADRNSRNVFFGQPGINLNVSGLTYNNGDAEYVALINETDFRRHFFDPKVGLVNALPLSLIWWTISAVGVGKQSIMSPYGNNSKIPKWRNCKNSGFCRHDNDILNAWLSSRNSIRLDQIPLPCKSGTLSKAMKIAILLSSGGLFQRQDLKVTYETLVERICLRLHLFGCLQQEKYAKTLIDEMVRLEVIKKDPKDALHRYRPFGRKVYKLGKLFGKESLAREENLLYYLAVNSWKGRGTQHSLDSF